MKVSGRGFFGVVVVVMNVALVAVLQMPSDAAPARNSGTCNPRKASCLPADTTPPWVAIAAPASGTTVAGTVTFAGTASDDRSLSRVEVELDGRALGIASGTTSWTFPFDTTAHPDGVHTLSAKSVDTAGNAATASVAVTVRNSAPSTSGMVLSNPAVAGRLVITGRGRIAAIDSLSLLIYQEADSSKPWAFVRDASTGQSTHVALPFAQWPGSDWSSATYVLTPERQLWVFSGAGPVHARRYDLSGSPLPTTATLGSDVTFGDADSRAGDLTLLASGALVAVWHQQGQSGPQGQGIAYRSPAGTWSTQYPLTFIPTRASVQAVAQHPSDGSVWVFSDPDAWSSIGVAHLTEGASDLVLDWTNPTFISSADEEYDADPEMADVEVAADPSTGTIAVAYQSSVRKTFSADPFVTGSHLAVARIAASGSKSFVSLPVYVERISQIGLTVAGGATWLAYRPIDDEDLSFDDLYVSRLEHGVWSPPQLLGRLYGPYDSVAFNPGRPEFGARLIDQKLYFFTP